MHMKIKFSSKIYFWALYLDQSENLFLASFLKIFKKLLKQILKLKALFSSEHGRLTDWQISYK